jgi:hypothetical protein
VKLAQSEAGKATSTQSKLSTDEVFARLKAEVKAHQERERTTEAEEKADNESMETAKE